MSLLYLGLVLGFILSHFFVEKALRVFYITCAKQWDHLVNIFNVKYN